MKIIVLLLLFLPCFGIAQLTDTTCISARWIALSPTEKNATIFGLDSTLAEEADLIRVIQRFVENNELRNYREEKDPNGNHEWYFIDYQKELHNAIDDTNNWDDWRPYFTMYRPQPDIPIVDEFGEPMTMFNPATGFEEYVYPTREVYYFATKQIDEIRIKEKRILNPSTNQYEFVPVGLSFYFKSDEFYSGYEVFWVDLRELFKIIDEKNKYPWYKTLSKKEYQGFQYMQVSCYNNELRY